MIKTTILSAMAVAAMAAVTHASTVTLAGTRSGPFTVSFADGTTPVAGGLIRLGTLSGDPADSSIESIDAVFSEFGTAATGANGSLGANIGNTDGTPFNGQQIYVWVFNTPEGTTNATQQALLTVTDADAPAGGGDAWRYPVHTGTGSDSIQIALGSLTTAGGLDSAFTPDVRVEGNNIVLAPAIPEPSGALLAGLAGTLLFLRRRR